MNPIELGKFLASLRNEKNLTQEELAEKLFIDKRKVSRWECGTSIPEFDILVKLSEILDVSLYELSICKKFDKEKFSRKALNKFKSIKDLKKYNHRKKVLIFIYIILSIIFGITLTYTVRNQNSVEIYELISLDKNYFIEGNYIRYKNKGLIYIATLYDTLNTLDYNKENCAAEIAYQNNRIAEIHRKSTSIYPFNHFHFDENEILFNIDSSKEYSIRIICDEPKYKEDKNIIFDFKFKKLYSNKLFSF